MAGNKWSQFSEDQKDQLLDSLEGLYNESPQIQEAVEKKWGYTDPQLANRRAFQKENEDLRTKIEEMEAKQREKEIRGEINAEKDAAQRKYKLSDDEMKEVSKMMVESGIGRYDRAADYYVLSKKASAVPSTDKHMERTSLTLPGDAELYKNPIQWARKEAYKTLDEIERNRS